MGKNVQIFHGTLINGVKQLIGDTNCEASQWLKESYCQ